VFTFGASEEVVNFAYKNSDFIRPGANILQVPQQLVVRDNISGLGFLLFT
jgi:hypothetical protein